MNKILLIILIFLFIISCTENDQIEELVKNQEFQTNEDFILDMKSARVPASQLELKSPYAIRYINKQDGALRKTRTVNLISEEFVVSNGAKSNLRSFESGFPDYIVV